MPHLITKNAIKMYYEFITEAGDDKDICVLIGGLSRDHTIWHKVVPLLKADFQLLLLDNRDAGQSTVYEGEYGISDMADDVAALLHGLNLFPAHIIGHSMGGFMAIHLAAKYPALIKSLTLCSTAAKPEPALLTYLEGRIATLSQSTEDRAASKTEIDAVLTRLYAAENLQQKTFYNEILAYESNPVHPQSPQSFIRQVKACLQHDASQLVQEIIAPTLVVTGAQDSNFSPAVAERLSAKIAKAEVKIIPGAAHMLQMERPELLVECFRAFVKKLDKV